MDQERGWRRRLRNLGWKDYLPWSNAGRMSPRNEHGDVVDLGIIGLDSKSADSMRGLGSRCSCCSTSDRIAPVEWMIRLVLVPDEGVVIQWASGIQGWKGLWTRKKRHTGWAVERLRMVRRVLLGFLPAPIQQLFHLWEQLPHQEGFCHHIVHATLQTRFYLLNSCVRGHSDNGYMLA